MNLEDRRAQLYGLLGDLPERQLPIAARLLWQEERADYVLERLTLELNGIEPVPAYFVRPKSGGPFPCVLFNHAHGGEYTIGKRELIDGRPAQLNPPYAGVLATRGIAALCIDHWIFGERRGRTESEVFKVMLWHGQVLWGMMVYDSLRALD